MDELILFSTEHLISILIYSLIFIFLSFISNLFSKRIYASVLGIVILIIKIIELFIRHTVYSESIYQLLPLHLCNIALIFAIISMIFKFNFLFQLVFYFSIGAFFAIIFPENIPRFYDFRNISFFLTHFFIIFASWYEIINFKFKPNLKGLLLSFVILNFFILLSFKVNNLFGTNFMFTNIKPNLSSPLNYFGPWPYYIIISDCIFLFLEYIYYLPFKLYKSRSL
ncbi:TIGR02206 family membrane protein [Fusobacterium sp. MFO224]|uniref:TMEM164-related integral membrane acyltransferase n=1 Tax=Fusobacterium sp. MFO224 TaxID=3378070 RepID=UPI0038546E89